VANNFKYYAAHTDAEGPAMTWQIFALGWMTLHNHSAASAFFQKGHVDNVRPPFFVWRETLSGGCTPFLTGAGGFLQSVLNGVGGVRLEANALALTPSPPLVTGGNATQVSFESLNWRGATLRIEIDVAKVKVSQLTEGRHPLALKGHRGETHPLAVGGAPLELSRGGTVRLIEHSVA
jgi:trehalose/maltose hydrolase-like predicted phosphorylase